MQPAKPKADLKPLLIAWPFDPAHNVRIVPGADGRDVMQVRLPLGIEQYELDGRPDGLRPHNCESALDYHLGCCQDAAPKGRKENFRLSAADCNELFDEGVLYYCRYLHLFQFQDWRRSDRDTARNLQLFDFVQRYAQRKEDRQHLEQWRPYVLRMNAIARAMLEVGAGNHARAVQIIREAQETIEALPTIDNETYQIERDRSLQALRDAAEHIEKNRPLSPLEKLERDLHTAIESQAFERAAQLRDQIRALRPQS